MSNKNNMIPIPGRLHSVAVGEPVSGADEIFDDSLNKNQAIINQEVNEAIGTGGSVDSRIAAAVNIEKTRAEGAEGALDNRVDTLEEAVGTGGSVDSRISTAVATETTRAQAAEADRYTKNETYNKSELNNMITTPNQEYVSVIATTQTTAVTDVLPATGAADTTYRVGNWDGTQYNDSVFSEYAWNGSTYIKLSTKSQIGEVYDISANHSNNTYVDLAAALDGGNNIPQELRKGGMSVKFVQSPDNKYIQARLMAQTFTTDTTKWQIVDAEPIAGSKNLVEGGGIIEYLEYADDKLSVSKIQTSSSSWTESVDFIAAAGDIVLLKNIGTKNLRYVELQGHSTVSVNAGQEVTITTTSNVQTARIYGEGDGSCCLFINLSRNINAIYTQLNALGLSINELKSLFNEKANGISNGSWAVTSIEIGKDKNYTVRNTGNTTIGYFRVRNSSHQNIIELTDIVPGENRLFTISQDGVDIEAFSSPASSWIVFDSTSFITKAFEPSLTESDIVNISGNATNKLASQNLLKINNDTAIIDCPDYLKGILGFIINKQPGSNGKRLVEFEKFKITGFIHNSSWYLYLVLQGLYQDSWVNVDSVEILQSSAPANPDNVEIIESKYGGFKVWINWADISNYSSTSLNLTVKNSAVSYIGKYLDDKIAYLREVINYADYETQDRIKHIITVGVDKDFTTITAAYASITDSDYDNQYAIVVYPGTYNEKNLTPPAYTHTYGLDRETTIITSENLGGTDPVFNQVKTSKLSNLTVISYTGYCIHQDQSSLAGCLLVNTNLHCKKEYGVDVRNLGWKSQTNPSVLGDGAHLIGTRFVWNDSIFENGYCAIHTIGGATPSDHEYANQQIVFNNCKLVNAIIQPITLSKAEHFVDGLFNCEVNGLITQKGFPSIHVELGTRGDGDTTYNYVWNILGGNNKDFAVQFININDTQTEDCWEKVNTNNKTLVQLANNVSVSKYDIITIGGTKAVSSTKSYEVLGFALADGTGTVPVWVGDALSVSLPDGEYGIGADGTLSSSATDKIGFVTNGYFYRY